MKYRKWPGSVRRDYFEVVFKKEKDDICEERKMASGGDISFLRVRSLSLNYIQFQISGLSKKIMDYDQEWEEFSMGLSHIWGEI